MKGMFGVGLTLLFVIALIAAFASTAPRISPPEISGISIEPAGKSAVRISWNTDKETYGGIYLSEKGKTNETFIQEPEYRPSKNHSITINNLQPKTEYVFDIGAEFYGSDGITDEYSHKKAAFKMP